MSREVNPDCEGHPLAGLKTFDAVDLPGPLRLQGMQFTMELPVIFGLDPGPIDQPPASLFAMLVIAY
jgi:hypothetical protein